MKRIPTWVKWAALGAIVFWTLLATIRNCGGPDEKYWMRVAVHEQAMKDAAAAHDVNLAEIQVLKADNAVKDQDIRDKTNEIKTLKGKTTTVGTQLAGLKGENKRLREDAQAAIDANPALQALVANFDLRISKHEEKEALLELRLAKVGEPFDTGKVDSAGNPIIGYPENTVTWDLWRQVKNEGRRADLWEEDYNKSQGLLATERGLRLTAEKGWKGMSLLAKAEAVVIGGAVTYFGGKALGHALKLW